MADIKFKSPEQIKAEVKADLIHEVGMKIYKVIKEAMNNRNYMCKVEMTELGAHDIKQDIIDKFREAGWKVEYYCDILTLHWD